MNAKIGNVLNHFKLFTVNYVTAITLVKLLTRKIKIKKIKIFNRNAMAVMLN